MMWTNACKLTYRPSGPLFPAEEEKVRGRKNKGCGKERKNVKREEIYQETARIKIRSTKNEKEKTG